MDGKLIYKWWIFQQTIFDCRRIAGTLVNIGMCHSLFTNQWGKNQGWVFRLVVCHCALSHRLAQCANPMFSWCLLAQFLQGIPRVPQSSHISGETQGLVAGRDLVSLHLFGCALRRQPRNMGLYMGLSRFIPMVRHYGMVLSCNHTERCGQPTICRSFSEQNHGLSTSIILYIYQFAGGPYRLFIQSRLYYHIVFIDVVNPLINHGPLNPDLIVLGRQNTTPIQHVFLTGNKPFIIYRCLQYIIE